MMLYACSSVLVKMPPFPDWLQFEFTYDDDMMHIAWCCLEEVPYCFSRSSVQENWMTVWKMVARKLYWYLDQLTVYLLWSDSHLIFNSLHAKLFQWLGNDAQSLKHKQVLRQISRSHGSKNRRFGPKLGVSGLYLKLEFTDGYEMMHRARSSIVEVPYCF